MSKLMVFAWGGAIGMVLVTILATLIREPWIADQAYQRAYEDLKTNKIEEVVMDKYPALWIKWNVHKGEK
jgi:hypothetical protein